LLNKPKVNLAAMVQQELGFTLEKGHGAADWSVRPLPAEQLRYAVLDVDYLIELQAALQQQLVACGKWEAAQQEFASLVHFTAKPRGEDPWRRTSGMHKVRNPRQLEVVRQLWLARDEVAQRSDIATGRILPDAAIVAAAAALPKNVDELSGVVGFAGRGQQRRKQQWWNAIAAAYAVSESDLPARTAGSSGPPPPKSWADRFPQAYARWEAARSTSTAIAEQLDLPVENLVAPDVIRQLCWAPPVISGSSLDDLAEHIEQALLLAGARPWQASALAAPLAKTWPTDAKNQK
jgi:ribonuclease D